MMRVGIFLRDSTRGVGKTRLAATLGVDAADAVARAMAEDVVESLRGWAPTLFVAGDVRDPWIRGFGLAADAQCDASLGERMRVALDRLRGEGQAAALVGSDVPRVTGAELRAMEALLGDAELVLAPALDGGFTALALRPGVDAAFLASPAIRYSTASACADVEEAFGGRVLRTGLTDDLDDVDGARRFLASPAGAGSRTRAVLCRLLP